MARAGAIDSSIKKEYNKLIEQVLDQNHNIRWIIAVYRVEQHSETLPFPESKFAIKPPPDDCLTITEHIKQNSQEVFIKKVTEFPQDLKNLVKYWDEVYDEETKTEWGDVTCYHSNLFNDIGFLVDVNITYEGEENNSILNRILFETSKFFLDVILKQYRNKSIKAAINAILIDSYAHNISAHSLNFLQYLFGERASRYLSKNHNLLVFQGLKELGINHMTAQSFFQENLKNRESEESEDLNYQQLIGKNDSTNTIYYGNILDYLLYAEDSPGANALEYQYSPAKEGEKNKIPFPLDYAIAPLLRYLRNKGILWGGVLKDNVATPNLITNMYDALMEFCNNPLFIGSIVASEKIFIIHFFIHLYDQERVPKFATDEKSHFLSINLKDFIDEEIKNGHKNKDGSTNKDTGRKLKYIPEKHSPLSLVRLSNQHSDLRKKLKKIKVVFPGGDVGKQAFYTIIENTLRNAKHINKEHLSHIQDTGLDIRFFFRDWNLEGEGSDSQQETEKELLQVSLCLSYDYNEGERKDYFKNISADAKKSLFQSIRNSYGNILTDKGEPILGGSSQDKICAAALMYKHFTNVQKADGILEKYYPWMRFNIYTNNENRTAENESIYNNNLILDEIKKPQISLDKVIESLGNEWHNKDNKTAGKNDQQLFLKQFYLWKGDNLQNNNSSNNIDSALPARFKIYKVTADSDKKSLQKNGVVRIIDSEENEFIKAYRIWNESWLQDIETVRIFNQDYALNEPSMSPIEIKTAHDGEMEGNICKYRNHGILIEYFDAKKGIADTFKKQEFLETVLTRIYIFDNRLYNSFHNYSSDKINDLFPKQLRLHIHNESFNIENSFEEVCYNKINFLIIHLSYIEELFKGNENKVKEFIKQFIIPGTKPWPDQLRLVITTGRGSDKWIAEIKDEEYGRYCMNVPLESLQTAVEEAIKFKDDFDVKYNLCKVLFGS